MKFETLVLVLSLVSSAYCKECKPSANDLVKTLETEVDSFDQFVYKRYLESEEGTCQRVTAGMSRLRESFKEELLVVLQGALRRGRTIVDKVNGTDAGPCVLQIKVMFERTLKEETRLFQQCLDAPAATLSGLQFDLSRDTEKYADLKSRIKTGLKNCLINMPSICPKKTSKCMDTQILTFNDVAKSLTEKRFIRSPCMGKFIEVLKCFSSSFSSFINKAEKLKSKMFACISYEDNDSIRKSIFEFFSKLTFNSTLFEQVRSAQRKFEVLNSGVLTTLARYYELEKSAKMTYEFSPHDVKHFKQRLTEVFADHLSRVEKLRFGNRYVWPENTADKCCDQAISDIHAVQDEAAVAFEKCEKALLNETLSHMQQVRNELGSITKDLTLMGDPAILDCLNNGAILSENAVEGCYDLQLRSFRLNKQNSLEKVEEFMTVLEKYNGTYFNAAESTNTLCGHRFLDRTKWVVDKILFQLNRCPYNEFTKGVTKSYPTPKENVTQFVKPIKVAESTNIRDSRGPSFL